MTKRLLSLICVVAGAVVVAGPAAMPAPDSSVSATPVDQQEVGVTLGLNGRPKQRLALPNFTIENPDPELQAAVATLVDVLWNDLDFESEFYMIPRATLASIPITNVRDSLPYAQLAQAGADLVVVGTARRASDGLEVEISAVGTKGDLAKIVLFPAFKYAGGGCKVASVRFCAHFISDDFFRKMRSLDGVARTRIAFISDRDAERQRARLGAGAKFGKEVYFADYDGVNPQRITANQTINLAATWSPDARSLSWTTYLTQQGGGEFQDIMIANPFDGRAPTRPARGTPDQQNMLSVWSPDGSKLAFASNRSGDWDIWIVNRDGTDLHNLTNTRVSTESAPTWSPTGTQIAFTSNRTGSNQIYIIGVDGVGLERLTFDSNCDRPTWSPAPWNDIAYTAQRAGQGHDINVVDVATKRVITLSDSNGDYGSPSFAPNGRHVAVVSTIWGKPQIVILDRQGKIQRKVTDIGSNSYPNWSRTPGGL